MLFAAGIKRRLARLAWGAALISLTLDILVRTHVLSPNMIILHTGAVRIDVGDIAEVVVPMGVVALALGWFGRLLRARVYSGSQTERSGRQAQGMARR